MQEDQNQELMDQEGTEAFAAGFDDERGQPAEQSEQRPEQVSEENTPPHFEEPPAGQAVPQTEPAVQAQPAAPEPLPRDEPQQPKTVEIPEGIKSEFAELEQLSPEAAAIAREDSPEGETLRKRLAEYGADNAMDRAELFMARREREAVAAQQQAGMVGGREPEFRGSSSGRPIPIFSRHPAARRTTNGFRRTCGRGSRRNPTMRRHRSCRYFCMGKTRMPLPTSSLASRTNVRRRKRRGRIPTVRSPSRGAALL